MTLRRAFAQTLVGDVAHTAFAAPGHAETGEAFPRKPDIAGRGRP